jgi:hypothetical protein
LRTLRTWAGQIRQNKLKKGPARTVDAGGTAVALQTIVRFVIAVPLGTPGKSIAPVGLLSKLRFWPWHRHINAKDSCVRHSMEA